jgi:hypothetical protein
MQDPSPLPNTVRRSLWRTLIGMGLWHGLPHTLTQAANPAQFKEIRVITGPDSPSSRQMLQALRQRWPALIAEANPAAFENRRGPAVHVALGAVALQKALAADLKGLLLASMTSSQVYRQLLGADPPAGKDAARERLQVTGVFADTAPGAQMLLIQAIFGNHAPVGCLLSEASAHLEKPLRQAASQLDISLDIERVGPSTEIVRALTRLRDAQVLLAVPDNSLYTPDTLRAILESTYRRAMPVIGFSAATVAAGTLATTYCAIDDMATDLSELLDETGAGSAVPEPRFPRHWRVMVNESVARSLGVPIDDKVRQLSPTTNGRGN